MTFFLILAALHVVFLGAIYGRLDGGGIASVNEWVERTLIMFFFVLACAPFADYWAVLAYIGVAGIATGHGLYWLSRTVKYTTPERLDFFLRPFFGADPRTNIALKNAPVADVQAAMQTYGLKKLYWRCAAGMFVTGTLVGLPALVLALVYGEWIAAVCFAATGIVKALAYMTGYAIFGPTTRETEFAEYANGAARNALCLTAIYATINALL